MTCRKTDRTGSADRPFKFKIISVRQRNREIRHEGFRNIAGYLKRGDCLVLNDTKVIPARLIGEKEGTGAKIEVLLLKRK